MRHLGKLKNEFIIVYTNRNCRNLAFELLHVTANLDVICTSAAAKLSCL